MADDITWDDKPREDIAWHEEPQVPWTHRAAEAAKGLARGVTGALGSVADEYMEPFREIAAATRGVSRAGERSVAPVLNEKLGLGAKPQDTADKYIGSVSEAVGNPTSYIGPGGPIPKAIMAAGAGAGAEAGGELTEGTPYEPLGRMGGALFGGPLAARTARPFAGADQQMLADRGVRQMTPGQLQGGFLKDLEDKATSIPILGGFIGNARNRSIQGFNEAVGNQALDFIGERLERGTQAGHPLIDEVATKLGDAYDNLVPHLQFVPDRQFAFDMLGIHQRNAGLLPPAQLAQFDQIINQRFGRGGNMTGEKIKKLEEELNKIGSNYSSSADPAQRDLGRSITDVVRALRSNLERVNPAHAEELRNINSGWAIYSRMRDAASRRATSDGLFTPNDLLNAVKRGDKSVGKGSFARGDALMQDFAEAGQRVLPSKIADSGTPGRTLMAGAVGAGGYELAQHGLGALALPLKIAAQHPILSAATAGALSAYTRPSTALLNRYVNPGAGRIGDARTALSRAGREPLAAAAPLIVQQEHDYPYASGGRIGRAVRIAREVGGRISHKAGGGDLTDPFVTSADDDSWKDREAQLGLELTGGNKQSWSDWLKSDSIAQRAVDAANYVGRFARDVVNAPRAIYENPSKADQIGQRFMGGENWVANMAKSGATLPGDVYSGKTPIYATDATGERSINPEVIERTQDLAGMAGGQTLATAGREAAAAGAGRDLRVLGHQIASDTNAAGAPLSALEHAPKFYSALEQAVETAPIEKGTGKQWLGTLTNKGVKKEEMDHTGTRAFLEANADKPVSKADLAAHVGENKVELGEVNKGYIDKVEDNPRWQRMMAANDALTREYHRAEELGDHSRMASITDQMNANHDEMRYLEGQGEPSKYESYQLPGGENYRERLLTMPMSKDKLPLPEGYKVIENPGGSFRFAVEDASGRRLGYGNTAEVAVENAGVGLGRMAKGPNSIYQSSHWDEPNVLVHRRTNDRAFTEPLTEEQQAAIETRRQGQGQLNGLQQEENVLTRQLLARAKFLEKERTDQVMADFRAGKFNAGELRRRLDDWGDFPELKPMQDKLQELRAQKDAINKSLPPAPEPASKRSLHIEEIQSDWHQKGRKLGYRGDEPEPPLPRNWHSFMTERGFTPDEARAMWDRRFEPEDVAFHNAHLAETEARNIARTKYNLRVPDAPFKKSWHELALKDAIREAAEKGMDRISWTPGEAQAARYDLSKTVDSIRAIPASDAEGAKHITVKTKSGVHASATVDGEGKVLRGYDAFKDAEGKNLADLVGKDVAEKLLGEGIVDLQGDGLKVGGEGMKGFYDKIIPDAMNKIGKPHGVQVQKGEVSGNSKLYSGDVMDVPPSQLWENLPELRQDHATRRDFVDYYNDLSRDERAELVNRARSRGTQPVHYMDIPPSLKEQALKKGFALFEDSSTAGAPLSALERAAQQGYDTSTPLYHGTSKDKDFKSFKEGRHGTWTTQDPKEASGYAMQNDSKNWVYDTSPGAKPYTLRAVNSADRVMPLYGKPLENPAYVTSYPERLKNATNYKKAQSEWFDELRAKGHDGVILPGGIRVDFKPNENLRSQFAQFAPEQAGTKKGSLLRSDSAEAGAPISALAAQSPERQAFNKWFEGSKAVNEKGEPVTVYRGEHGELPEGEQHQTRLPGLTFVDNPDVANTYAMEPNNRNDRLHTPRVTPAHLSIKNPIIENHGDPFVDIRQLADKLGETEAKRIAKKYAYEIESTGNWQENIGKQYDNVEDFLKHEPKDKWNELYFDTYQYLDDPHEVNIAKAHGYDGAIHLGNGESATDTEYRVFSPHQVRSAILPEDSATAGAPLAALEKKNSRARDPNLWHGISDVKLPKPISEMSATREQTAGAAPSRIIRPADLQGSQLLPLIGDRSAAGAALTEVGGKRLAAPVDLQGGHGFMAENADRGAAWASGKMVATGIANRVKAASEKGPVHGVYTAMGERSVDFSHHVSDTLTEMLKHAKIGRDDRRAFDDAMRSKDANFPAITDWPGLGSSKLRSYLADATGQVRNKFAKTMDTRQFQAAGFPSVAEARFAVIDPKLLHEPVGASGLSVARLEPRAFPSQHRSYDTNVGGEYVGGLPTSVPKEVMYPKIMKSIEKYRKGMTGYVPTADYLMSRTPKGLPLTETADQKWVDTVSEFLRSRGYKGLKRGGRA